MFCFRRFEVHSKLRTCTKFTSQYATSCPPLPPSVRVIPKEDINNATRIFHAPIAKGAFGKCLRTRLGPFDDVCIKVFIKADDSSACHFYNEVFILQSCCHPNIPWLLEINDSAVKMMVLSFISYYGKAVNLFEAVQSNLELVNTSWIRILTGTANAMLYLVRCSFLHNDIKCDNIMLHSTEDTCTGVLIDFGKACLLKNGQRYHLAPSLQKEYLMKHSHIPPDVVYGRSRQSHASDVYAFGKVIKHINAEKLNIPLLQSIGSLCIESDASNRPSAQDIHTSLSNLL